MIADFKHIEHQIRENGYKTCRIFDGFRGLDGRDPVELVSSKTEEELISKISYYDKNYPGKYILQLATNSNMLGNNPRTIKVDFVPEAQVMGTTLQGNTPQSIVELTAQITAQVREEIRKEDEIRREREEMDEIRRERDELKTGAGKIAEIFTQVVMGMMTPNSSPGTQAPTPAMQGTEPTKEELNEALIRLVEALGTETIIKLSNKITPQLIAMVQTFANS